MPIDEKKKETRKEASPWAVLGLLTLGWMIAFIDRTSMSSAMADPVFVHQFGLSHVERGWLGSAVFWSYAAVQIPMGWVVDRYGVKWPYAICFGLWCLAAAATGLATTLGGVVVIRLLIGVTEAVVIPASYRFIADHFEEARKGTATGIYSLGGKLGPAIGAALSATLIAHWSWTAMFVLTGLVGLVWLVPWLMFKGNDFPTPVQLEANRRRAALVPLRSLLVSPVVWGGMLLAFADSYFVFYAATWMPAYLVEQRGLSLMNSGFYTFASFAGVALVGVVSGWAADRFIARGFDAVRVRQCFVTAGMLGGMTLLLGAYAHTLQAALFWNVASLWLIGLSTANALTLAKLTLIPKPAVGLNTGLLMIATSLAGGVSASLSGWLMEIGGSYAWPMLSVCAFLLVGIFGALVLMRREWAPKVVAPEAGFDRGLPVPSRP